MYVCSIIIIMWGYIDDKIYNKKYIDQASSLIYPSFWLIIQNTQQIPLPYSNRNSSHQHLKILQIFTPSIFDQSWITLSLQ